MNRVRFPAIVDHVDHYEMKMTSMDQERWLRVKDRLRVEVGEDIYLSWLSRMELDAVEVETIKLSVPPRFLKSWIQSHYAEKLLGCWQSEQPTTTRIELTVRSAAIRQLPPKIQLAEPPLPLRETKLNGHDPRGMVPPLAAAHDGLGGSPLDPRLTFDAFVVRRPNTLAPAADLQVARGLRGDPGLVTPV